MNVIPEPLSLPLRELPTSPPCFIDLLLSVQCESAVNEPEATQGNRMYVLGQDVTIPPRPLGFAPPTLLRCRQDREEGIIYGRLESGRR